MPLRGNQKCKLADSTRLAVQNEFGILLDTGHGTYYSLTPVGTAICLSLRDETTVDSLLTTLQGKYEVPLEILRNDLAQFLASLHAKRLCTLAK